MWCLALGATAWADPVVEAGAGVAYAKAGSTIPVVSDPANWSGLMVIEGWAPMAHAAAGMRYDRVSILGETSFWWAPAPREFRNGHLAPPENVLLAGAYLGVSARLHFGPGLHAGAGLGIAGVRFRTSDSFVITRKPGPGVSAELGWTHALESGLGLGVALSTTGHVIRQGGPIETRWSGSEVGLRVRVVPRVGA